MRDRNKDSGIAGIQPCKRKSAPSALLEAEGVVGISSRYFESVFRTGISNRYFEPVFRGALRQRLGALLAVLAQLFKAMALVATLLNSRSISQGDKCLERLVGFDLPRFHCGVHG